MTGVVAVLAGGAGDLVSVFPGSAFVTGDTSPLFTRVVTASVAGGGTFTFVWTYVDGDTEIVTAFPDGPAMSWKADIPPSTIYNAGWRVTALQSGTPIGFADVAVNITRL